MRVLTRYTLDNLPRQIARISVLHGIGNDPVHVRHLVVLLELIGYICSVF